jgi:hypothetical protein
MYPSQTSGIKEAPVASRLGLSQSEMSLELMLVYSTAEFCIATYSCDYIRENEHCRGAVAEP